jgi:hypothetical protein
MTCKPSLLIWRGEIRMYHFINKLEAWACISHLAQEWYWRKFQSEIIITLIVYYIYLHNMKVCIKGRKLDLSIFSSHIITWPLNHYYSKMVNLISVVICFCICICLCFSLARGTARWACIAHLAQAWYWSKFQSEIIVTLTVFYIYA